MVTTIQTAIFWALGGILTWELCRFISGKLFNQKKHNKRNKF